MGQQLLRRFKGYGCSMIGACRVVAYAEDVVVILNSPLGCAHVLRDRELERNYQATNAMRGMFNSIGRRIVYTNLTNDDCIYGSGKKLAAAIGMVAELYNPAYILVVNSCMVGIIGDDIEAVAEEAEVACKVPVLAINSFGFMNGAYSNGFKLAVSRILSRFCTIQEKQDDTIVIIAPFEGKHSAAFRTIKQYLCFLGLKKVILFPGAASLEEIKLLCTCRYGVIIDHNNMLATDYEAAAEVLHERLGIQILDYADPAGFKETLSWLEKIHTALQSPESSYKMLREQLKQQYSQIINDFLAVAGKGNTVSIVIRDAKVILNFTWLNELLDDLQIEVEGIYIDRDNSMANGNVLDTLLYDVQRLSSIERFYLTVEEISLRLDGKNVLSVRVPRELLPFAVSLPYMNMGLGLEGLQMVIEDIKRMIVQKKHRGYYE